MRKVLLLVAALVCSDPCHAQGSEETQASSWRSGTPYADNGPLTRAATDAVIHPRGDFPAVLMPREARVPGRTCARRVVNGIVIAATIGAVSGLGMTGGRASGAWTYAKKVSPVGGIAGYKSCRP